MSGVLFCPCPKAPSGQSRAQRGSEVGAKKRPPLWVVLLGYLVLDDELVNNPEAGSTYDEYVANKIVIPNLT